MVEQREDEDGEVRKNFFGGRGRMEYLSRLEHGTSRLGRHCCLQFFCYPGQERPMPSRKPDIGNPRSHDVDLI